MIEGKNELSGEDAFKLYDTYGFPIELTKEICLDSNVNVDIAKFEECLNKQKELARASRKNIESFNKQSKDLLEFDKPSEYTYSSEKITSKVIGLFNNGVKVDQIDDEGDVVFETQLKKIPDLMLELQNGKIDVKDLKYRFDFNKDECQYSV